VNEQVSVGAQLRAARDNARYSIEEIADRTYIRPTVIKDLEEDKELNKLNELFKEVIPEAQRGKVQLKRRLRNNFKSGFNIT